MKKVGISAGHNDRHNIGADGILNEDAINLAVTLALMKKFKDDNLVEPIRLYKTDVIGYNDSLNYRPLMANELGCDVIIDIHHNSFSDPSANGCEALALGENSNRLGECILNEVAKLGYRNRGVKYNNYAFNKLSVMPSVIFETFFISNVEDCNKYNAIGEAEAIAKGIYKFLGITYVEKPTEKYYIVVPGDTLYGIARKLKVAVDYLIKKNNIQNPNLIRVNQKIFY